MVNSLMCPMCESGSLRFLSRVKDVEYWTSNNFYLYYECLSCAVIFLKDPPTDHLNEIYPDCYYSTELELSNNFSLWGILNYIKIYLDKSFFCKILKFVDKKDKLSCLDIGGGSGWMMNIIKALDKKVQKTVVLDLNEKSRPLAEKNGHVFLCKNVNSLNFDEEFDVVLLFNLIEHVSDPSRILSLIYKSLSPGGIAIVKTPNSLSWNKKIFERHYWGGYHAPRHWVIFNEENFRKVSEKNNFHVERIYYTQGAHQWAASILGTYFSNEKMKKVMHERPMFSLLLLFFSIFDFLLLPFHRTDQFFAVLRKQK